MLKEVREMGKGKGWFGDSEGHAKSGRKGGLARGKRAKQAKSNLKVAI